MKISQKSIEIRVSANSGTRDTSKVEREQKKRKTNIEQ